MANVKVDDAKGHDEGALCEGMDYGSDTLLYVYYINIPPACCINALLHQKLYRLVDRSY